MPKLSENQFEKQPLLEDFGIITTPLEMNYETFREVEWAIEFGRSIHRKEPLTLRVIGWGGHLYVVRSLIDLINNDGNINSVLYGESVSAHSLLWAGCENRYVNKNSVIGVHGGSYYFNGTAVDTSEMKNFTELSVNQDEWAAKIYANACGDKRYKKSYWKKVLSNASVAYMEIPAKILVEEMEMAQYWENE